MARGAVPVRVFCEGLVCDVRGLVWLGSSVLGRRRRDAFESQLDPPIR